MCAGAWTRGLHRHRHSAHGDRVTEGADALGDRAKRTTGATERDRKQKAHRRRERERATEDQETRDKRAEIGQPSGAAKEHDKRARVRGQSREPGRAPSRAGQGRNSHWLEVWVLGRRKVRLCQQEPICLALRFQIANVMLECNFWNTTSAETKLRLRAMDLPRQHKTVSVSWWGRVVRTVDVCTTIKLSSAQWHHRDFSFLFFQTKMLS